MTPAETEELLDLVRSQHILLLEIKSLNEEHVIIAREYKKILGDPLKHGVWFIKLLSKLLGWFIGILLTLWGLRELFDNFFESKK